MSSIVDTSVKNFNSTMTGAPALSGTVGSLVNLLDAVLVNGFDLKTASSLTVAGGVASLAFTGSHSAQLDSVVVVAGITGAYVPLNGEQKVTGVAGGLVKFATSAADGTAAGTITFKMAPAGWEKVFAGVNKAVYRSLDPASTKMLLRVDDSAAQFARVVGYESMSDVDTGAGPFPTAAQIAGGGYWAKSLLATATAVPWAIHADGRMLYLSSQPGISNVANYTMGITRCFGDLTPFRPGGDGYGCVLSCSAAATIQSMNDGHVLGGGGASSYGPRSYTGLGGAVNHGIAPFVGVSTAASGITGDLGAFPSVIDGSLWLTRKFAALGSVPRGDMPGVCHSPQSALFTSFTQLDRVPGTGVVAGRTLQAVTAGLASTSFNNASNVGNCGIGFFDITGPWR